MTIVREQLSTAMLDDGECPEAVELQFENKVEIIEWSGPLQERHWLELSGHQCNQNSRMEYEDALPGDSNSALHYPKASPRKLLRGIGAQAITNPAMR